MALHDDWASDRPEYAFRRIELRGTRACLQPRRRSRRCSTWALSLLAGLWICGAAPAVFAQDERTLVSNTGQATAADSTPVLSIQSLAKLFTTGASTDPWTLTAIQLDVGAWQPGATPTVSLRATSDDLPATAIATLTNPPAGAGLQSFTPASDTTVSLQASTTYAVVIESDTTFSNYNGFTLLNTESAAEDSGGADGWQIGDRMLINSGNGWSESSRTQRLRMAVLGTAATASDDATLGTLTLTDSGSPIALDPTFGSGTTSYTASVAHSVSTVTVTATATDTSASVSISNDDDTATPGTAGLALVVGANTVTVTVTAEDDTTTRTYTVAVTRAAPPDPTVVPHTLVANMGQATAANSAPVFALYSVATQFSTGSTARRWTLTSINLAVSAWQSGVTPTVSLHASSGQLPGTKIATLTNPAAGTGVRAFTAPSGTTLDASTTYTVVIESADLNFNGFALLETASAAEDSASTSGWLISDSKLTNQGQGWSVSSGSKKPRLAVVGTVDSDDATLSGLALADGNGTAVSLDPAFASATTDYTASVAHTVGMVTVTADAAHADATVSIDADDDTGTPDTAELDLAVGENSLSVTVTAEDTATTKTYTVTVTRADAIAPPAPQTLVSNVGQTANVSAPFHDGQRRVGTQFTTGSSATAWSLSAVRLQVDTWRSGVAPTVKLRRVVGEWPGATIATLKNPSRGTGLLTFTAPSGLKLEPDTNYAVVVAARSGNRGFRLGLTKSNDEDAGGSPGWRIDNRSRADRAGTWTEVRPSLVMDVQGTPVADDATPGSLTGWFAWKPVDHDGFGEFTVRIGFSDPIRSSREAMRDHAVQVSGGRVTIAKRLQTHSDMWNIKVTPTGIGPITVAVEGGLECSAAAAVCTRDGRSLAESLTLTVPGPLALSVADAEAREGTDSAAVFAVTLNRPSTERVTVDYATADGTARAGQDYTATSGTLTFAPGTVEQSVSVPVLDDAVDEGEETFSLTLSNASGALLGDGEAAGTITNSDPMPKAWLAHFGKAVASQAVNAIGSRLEGSTGSGVVVGGMALDGQGIVLGSDADRAALRLDGSTLPDVRAIDAHDESLSPRTLLLSSAFQLGGASETDSTGWTAWGRFSSSGFDSAQDDARVDGDVTSAFLGADVSRGRWLAGVAVSRSDGDGAFDLLDGGENDSRVTVDSHLSALYPYARFSMTKRTVVWAMAGYGTGELTLTEPMDTTRPRDVESETDLAMRMGAIGTRGEVLPTDASGGVELVLRSDAFWVRMESEAVESERSGRLEASTGDASRLRLVLEGSRTFDLGSGWALAPSAAAGVRHDGGDAGTGTGVEVGAGMRLAARGITIGGRVRTLVTHESDGLEEWGASWSIGISPSASGQGLSLTLAPSWGTASSGVDRLWSLGSTQGLVRADDFGAGSRVEAELGYGFRLTQGRGVLTPYAGLSWEDGGNRAYRTGTRWRVGPGTALGLELAHRTTGDDTPPVNSLALRARVRW